jgi:integrase
MKFASQAEHYIKWIQSRRRNPVRPATARIYQSYLDAHVVPYLGEMPLNTIENGVAKDFVAHLNSLSLAPSTINSIFNLVTAVVASAMDENGNERFPRRWNRDFIDLPIVNKADADAPIVTPEQVLAACQAADRQQQAMLVLLAASGLRVGELLALQGHSTTYVSYRTNSFISSDIIKTERNLKGTYGFSYWDPEKALICVKSTLVRGKIEPQPKTDAGNREIDLHPDVNKFLLASGLPETGYLFQSSRGGRVRVETAYDQLEDVGITEGFHAFRRFRATHLESQNVPRSLTGYWLGHSGNSITDRYIKIGQDLETRRDWAARAGYGFELPKN